MALDHIGMLFYPDVSAFRIVGRFAFPIFAFLLAEGCRYTRNRAKHFWLIFGLGVFCVIAYYVFDRSFYGNILITFSLSTLIIYAVQNLKKAVFADNKLLFDILLALVLLFMAVSGSYLLTTFLIIDYGFSGILTPVFIALVSSCGDAVPPILKKLDNLFVKLILLSAGLIWVSFTISLGFAIQIYSLIAVALLMLYNGKRGSAKLKYFFYIFYPVHLALLQLIAYLVG